MPGKTVAGDDGLQNAIGLQISCVEALFGLLQLNVASCHTLAYGGASRFVFASFRESNFEERKYRVIARVCGVIRCFSDHFLFRSPRLSQKCANAVSRSIGDFLRRMAQKTGQKWLRRADFVRLFDSGCPAARIFDA